MPMSTLSTTIRPYLDRLGLALSSLCAVHCVGTLVLVSLLGLSGGALLSPVIHETGLALAIAVAVLTLGVGAVAHGRTAPLKVGIPGIVLMACALMVPHGWRESVLTIAGVALVATAHWQNLRHSAPSV